jgi:hypothetical protein
MQAPSPLTHQRERGREIARERERKRERKRKERDIEKLSEIEKRERYIGKREREKD